MKQKEATAATIRNRDQTHATTSRMGFESTPNEHGSHNSLRVHLLLKGGLVAVTGTDGDTEGDGLLLGLAGDVLPDGDGRVDTTTLKEEGSDGTARTLGSDEDDIDVRGRDDLGLFERRRVGGR
jgi:hypothetical protein